MQRGAEKVKKAGRERFFGKWREFGKVDNYLSSN